LKKRKKKKRSLLAWMMDGLLSLIDLLCEGAANLCVGLIKGIFRLLCLALSGVWRLAIWLLACVCRPFGWLFRRMNGKYRRASQCLRLDGQEFESYVAQVLEDNGFRHVALTKGSGDQGVDILAERGGKTYAIQCKNYEGAVGNFAVQEAYAGAQFYGCDLPAVICPGTFTRGAKELAETTGVLLWDGKKLSHMMKISGRRPRHRV